MAKDSLRWPNLMRNEELRPALYHRLHYLVPVISPPTARLIGRLALRGLLLLYFAFVLLILVLRYLILPNSENYRPEIERQVGQALGLSVGIGGIEASWQGLNPDLILSDVRIADAQGQPALAFSRVESVLSWSSLPRLQLRLSLLRLDEPRLHLRRDVDGQFYVAGIAGSQQGSHNGVAERVLGQERIRVNGATVVWEDALPETSDIDLSLFNQFEGMKFGAIRNRLGDEGIIKLFNFDWQKIELFIKAYNTNNYRHYKKTIRAVYNDLNQQVNKTNLNLINHVKTLLYAA